jgi:hypothetical protein
MKLRVNAVNEEPNKTASPLQPQIIRPAPIQSRASVGTPTVWLSYHFAPEWFADALNEMRSGRDHHARRREIVFAVCCAESYLVEWVRDEVLNRDFNRLNQFFPSGEKRGAAEKWKEIPKALYANGLIAALPDLGKSYWQEWIDLVELRNGLIHARSSRPETSPQPPGEQPRPSKGDLDKLAPGWATKVVVTLIQELHAAVGTSPPVWLVVP